MELQPDSSVPRPLPEHSAGASSLPDAQRALLSSQTARPPHSLWRNIAQALRHWYGIIMTLAVAVSALWLVATGQHTLYIHPRYTIFIIEMSAIALAACLWALWRGLPTPSRPDDEAARAGSPRQWQRRGASVATALLVVSASVMVLLVPPAPLSPSTAAQRGGGRATSTTAGTVVRHLADLPEQPRISDWAMLLVSQTKDDLTGVPATIEGFVTTRPEIADSGYYLVRFTIVCCAVDAFPASIPIYDPQWRDHVEVGQWLQIDGAFQPSTADIHEQYMLHPKQVTPIPEPEQPYLF